MKEMYVLNKETMSILHLSNLNGHWHVTEPCKSLVEVSDVSKEIFVGQFGDRLSAEAIAKICCIFFAAPWERLSYLMNASVDTMKNADILCDSDRDRLALIYAVTDCGSDDYSLSIYHAYSREKYAEISGLSYEVAKNTGRMLTETLISLKVDILVYWQFLPIHGEVEFNIN